MSLSSFLSRTVKFEEAALASQGASALQNNAAALEALVDATAPQGVAAVIAAVEKADGSVIGPGMAALVNTELNIFQAQIDAAIAPLVAQGGPIVEKVAAALQAESAKLQAEALNTH